MWAVMLLYAAENAVATCKAMGFVDLKTSI